MLPGSECSLHDQPLTGALVFLIRGRATPFAGTLPSGERPSFFGPLASLTSRSMIATRSTSDVQCGTEPKRFDMPGQVQSLPLRVYRTDHRIMVVAPMAGLESTDISMTETGKRVTIQ